MDQDLKQIFSGNSTSYYYSSLFFRKNVREDVFKLYAYVRTADDFVDETPQQPEKLEEFRDKTLENWSSGESGDKIVDYFLEVARKNNFEKEWAEAFIDSMKMDTKKDEYETMEETLEYIYGSAEVIGLMMARLLDLESESEEYACMLGRSMQYCNFLRDIEEDYRLGRRYMPMEEMQRFGIETLKPGEVDEEKFRVFMKEQIKQYFEWQEEAEKGLKYIPYRERVPVTLSSRLYKWTAKQIHSNPMVVYDRKVRPSKTRISIELLKAFSGIK